MAARSTVASSAIANASDPSTSPLLKVGERLAFDDRDDLAGVVGDAIVTARQRAPIDRHLLLGELVRIRSRVST